MVASGLSTGNEEDQNAESGMIWAPKQGTTLRSQSTLEVGFSSMMSQDVVRGVGGGERPRHSAEGARGTWHP